VIIFVKVLKSLFRLGENKLAGYSFSYCPDAGMSQENTEFDIFITDNRRRLQPFD